MKKILIWILVLTLIAVASAVATIAYFMYDTPLEENTMTVGNASIELVEYQRGADGTVDPFVNDKILIPSTIADGFEYDAVNYDPKKITADTPCVDWNSIKEGYKSPIWDSANINDEIDKMVFVRNTGNTDVYVRVCFAFEAGNYVWLSHFDRMVHLNKNDKDWTWSWKNDVVEINGTRYFIAWATYNHVLPAGEYTNISLSQIALDVSAISDHARAFGEKYEVMAFAQGIQAHGFTDATDAFNKGFGAELPFRNVKEVNFVDLYTALHYLNADKTSEENKITKKVKNITFGLTGDYPEVVNAYDGVPVANKETGVDNNGNVTTPEADFTAYAYYVPISDGKYDIYVLADNWKIYAPNNSGSLFDTMEVLVKVDTSNLDVSYTTSMFKMFHDCWELAEIDISHWVVDNVTNMAYMFQVCKALTELDCSNWDVSNVTDMDSMFHRCINLKTVDVSNWDVSKVTNMHYLFSQDENLENLNISGWNFGDDNAVSLTNMDSMFNGCSKLEYIDVANWNVSKVTNMSGTFVGCTALKSLDVSRWNVGNVTTMNQMFRNCENLASVDVSKWNVSNVVRMAEMFFNMSKLTKLDLSSWNTANVLDSKSMFSGCSGLTTIYVSDSWTMSQVVYVYINTNDHYESNDMFKNCKNLVGGNGTKFNESNPTNKTYAIIDGGTSNPGYLTKK